MNWVPCLCINRNAVALEASDKGYLYSKPMSKAQLIGLMRKRFVDAPVAAAAPAKPEGIWVRNFSKS